MERVQLEANLNEYISILMDLSGDFSIGKCHAHDCVESFTIRIDEDLRRFMTDTSLLSDYARVLSSSADPVARQNGLMIRPDLSNPLSKELTVNLNYADLIVNYIYLYDQIYTCYQKLEEARELALRIIQTAELIQKQEQNRVFYEVGKERISTTITKNAKKCEILNRKLSNLLHVARDISFEVEHKLLELAYGNRKDKAKFGTCKLITLNVSGGASWYSVTKSELSDRVRRAVELCSILSDELRQPTYSELENHRTQIAELEPSADEIDRLRDELGLWLIIAVRL